jgi:hypothetical protein
VAAPQVLVAVRRGPAVVGTLLEDADMKVITITALAAAALTAPLLAAACGSGSASTPPQPAAGTSQASQAASSPPAISALDQCAAAVDQLLVQDLNAIEQGYNGIDINQVMVRYGVQLPVFETYSQLQAQLAENAFEHGAANALAPVERQVRSMCQEYGADPPPGQQPAASPAPASPAPAAASSVPPANASGCPGSAQLLAAWDAAPPAARRSWITGMVPSGMADITCWRMWAVASPVVQANGLVVFHEQEGRWHLLPETELNRFNTAICGSADAPPAWSGPAGPATCS